MRRLKLAFFASLSFATFFVATITYDFHNALRWFGLLATFASVVWWLKDALRVGSLLRLASEARRAGWEVSDQEVIDAFGELSRSFSDPPPDRDDIVDCPYFHDQDSDIGNFSEILLNLSPHEIALLTPAASRPTPRWRFTLPSARQLSSLRRGPGTPKQARARLDGSPPIGPRPEGVSAAGRIARPSARELLRGERG